MSAGSISKYKVKGYVQRLSLKRKLLELKLIREQHGFSTMHIDMKIQEHHPKLVFLDTEDGLSEVAEAIAHNHPVVTDYGATYGTTFSLKIRKEIAEVRMEQEPFAIVSLVCSRKDAMRWLDTSRLHPVIVDAIDQDALRIIEDISFLRFPCTDEAAEELGEYYVNQDQEIQVFIVEDDPLMDYLAKHHGIHYIAVRSSNITGMPEEPFVKGAEVYASAIGAPIFAIRSKRSLQIQLQDQEIASSSDIIDSLQRKRVGSQPILALTHSQQDPVIQLVRAGNTDPDTMKRLLKNLLDYGIDFEYVEEKLAKHKRMLYQVDPGVVKPEEIKQELLKASSLI